MVRAPSRPRCPAALRPLKPASVRPGAASSPSYGCAPPCATPSLAPAADAANPLRPTGTRHTSCCGRLAPAQHMARPDNWPRTILHVDLDAFDTSVHERDDLKLRGIPVAVAGRSPRPVVMAASCAARAYGVRPALRRHAARRLYPQRTAN